LLILCPHDGRARSTEAAVESAAPGVVGLSLELDQMSATYLSKAVEILVRPKYASDSNTRTTPEDKISSLSFLGVAIVQASETFGS
jgi:hypothetical protein